MQQKIHTKNAPEAIGPYSQAVVMAGLVLCSGQVHVDPKNGKLVEGDVKEQTKQVLENLKAVLEAANADLTTVLKTTVYLTDVNDFAQMNEVYAQYFTEPYPARATVGVAALPKGARIEIECMAFTKPNTEGCCGGDCQCGGSEI
jgi:2-iminobutanoate/2-iminopropanoate deaminase